MKTNLDVFGDLFRKVRIHDNHTSQSVTTLSSYILLIQYSLSLQKRQNACNDKPSAEEDIYRRAGLRTPSENALRDLEGAALWNKYLTKQMSQETTMVIWLRTSTRRQPSWLQNISNLKVIDAAMNPFGWSQDSSCAVNMDDLNLIVNGVQLQVEALKRENSASCCGLVIETLSPLLLRHGLNQVTRLLKKLSSLVSSLVVSVSTESLGSMEHRELEDMAQALLSLQGGEAVLLRKGVRERDNVKREQLHFEIQSDARGERSIELVEKQADTETNQAPSGEDESAHADPASTVRHSHPSRNSKERPKVALRLEEEEGPRQVLSSAAAPRIVIEDDDPEYDDYDEEDPDDDLDL